MTTTPDKIHDEELPPIEIEGVEEETRPMPQWFKDLEPALRAAQEKDAWNAAYKHAQELQP